MLKLAALIQNPGEPAPDSRYQDPEVLRDMGYNGLIIHQTTGLSGIESTDAIVDGEVRRWVNKQFEQLEKQIATTRAAGLAVYLTYDVLSLSQAVVDTNVGAVTCKNRPLSLCPASEVAMQLSMDALAALLRRYPDVAGIVLRFGDNDASRLLHLVGNDIYAPHCPRCADLGRADRVGNVIQRCYDLVVQEHDKRLIVRTWNAKPNGMHDALDVCERVAKRLPGADRPADDRLILSFKFTETDFWRYQPWNRCSLAFGDRPIVYELECQREYEAKGGIPNWQAPLWQGGAPEIEDGQQRLGLAAVHDRVNLAGLWAWVRGGGWGGPFVKNESWIDANVFAVPRLADDPSQDLTACIAQWASQWLGLSDGEQVETLSDVLTQSTEMIRKAFYIEPLARSRSTPWHPNADWVQDDLVDALAAWRIIQRLPDSSLDAVLREKQAAVDTVGHCRSQMQKLANDGNRKRIEPLLHSLLYAESLFEAVRDLLAGLVAYKRYQKTGSQPNAELCRQRLLAAQSHWNHHTQRHGSLHGAATPFRESHFWELTQRLLSEVG